MYSLNDLSLEIDQVIEQMDSAARLHPDWITQAVLNRHPDSHGADRDFYTVVGRAGGRGPEQ